MKKDVKNHPDSIRAKISNIANTHNREFNSLLLQFFQERLLYRLSVSRHSEKFTLKGGLVFLVYTLNKSRPTKDIDLLGSLKMTDSIELVNIFKEIISIQCEDGISFDSENILVSPINENEKYEYSGFQLKILAHLGQARLPISIDVGTGDAVFPVSEKAEYPVLLDYPAPMIKIYSKESVIAEKFETMVKMGLINSRLKDFYDIWFLAGNFIFRADILFKAVQQTFEKRHSNIDDRKFIFSDSFKNNPEKKQQWRAFLNKSRLTTEHEFPDVLELIENFLDPLFSGIIEKKEIFFWNNISKRWKEQS